MRMKKNLFAGAVALVSVISFSAPVFPAADSGLPEGLEAAEAAGNPFGDDDGPAIAAVRPWETYCVPFFVRMNTDPYLEKLDYIVTVFQIMAYGSGNAGWGRGKLPYYLPDDEHHTLRTYDFRSDNPSWAVELAIDYQVHYCDFEGIVEDVADFVDDYNSWEWFFCQGEEAGIYWEEYGEYLCDESGICEGDEEFPTYAQFKDVLARAVDNALEDLFDDFYGDIYDENNLDEIGLYYILEEAEDGDDYGMEEALEDTYDAAVDYYEALEAALDGYGAGYFELSLSDIDDAW